MSGTAVTGGAVAAVTRTLYHRSDDETATRGARNRGMWMQEERNLGAEGQAGSEVGVSVGPPESVDRVEARRPG
jgi:hypothetical protein